MHISKKDLAKVSFINTDDYSDRTIPLHSCYLGNSNWETWVPTEKGLLEIKIIDIADACYYSKEPAKETDVFINFVNLILKRAYFKDLVHFEQGILEDLNNLATSVVKLELFHDLWLEKNELINFRFVTTELEYILKVCRSLFDLLQEVIKRIWKRFQYLDTSKKTKDLKSTFSKMVLFDDKLSNTKTIEDRFNIPPQLAAFYSRNGVFFEWLRSYRDKITHSGENIERLYFLEEGFAISTEIEPFRGLHIWDCTELKPNNLGSVRSLVAYTILNTINALEDFTDIIQSIMKLPEDISPDHKVFIRGENLHVLKQLHLYAEGKEWKKI